MPTKSGPLTAVRARKALPLVPECHTSVKKRRRPEPVSPLLLNRSGAVSGRCGMDERQKLQSDLKRYRTLRDLIHDEPAMATIEEMIREAEDRLRQIESGPIKRSWPPSLSGARQRAFRPRGPAPSGGLPERRIPHVVQSLDVRSDVSKPSGGDFYHGPPHHYYGGGLGLVAADRRFGPSLPCFLQ